MNEPYRSRQPGPQSSPGTGHVVRAWANGQVIPLFYSACALVVLVLLVLVALHFGEGGLIVFQLIAFAVFAGGIAAAFRRKVTLTTDQLIIRQLFRTQVLPLHEITEVFERRNNAFLPNPVVFELPRHRSYVTMAFGWKAREARVVIAKAAKAAGSPIDI